MNLQKRKVFLRVNSVLKVTHRLSRSKKKGLEHQKATGEQTGRHYFLILSYIVGLMPSSSAALYTIVATENRADLRPARRETTAT